MSDYDPERGGAKPELWLPRSFQGNYDEEGRANVEARRLVDSCLPLWTPEGPYADLDHYVDPEGIERVKPVDFEHEFMKAAHWMGKEANIMDTGCSFPFLLIRLQQEGFSGRLVGVEPNTAQFNGLPFWEPKGKSQEFTNILTSGNDADLIDFFELHKTNEDSWPGIELYKSDANFLPVLSDSMDVVAFMFSFYHIHRNKQWAAINEVRRVLKKQYGSYFETYGIMALATSGDRNKIGMRYQENQIERQLKRNDGRDYTAPPPLSSGFTSEDAREVLVDAFRFVYEFNHKGEIVIDTHKRVEIILAAHRTLRKEYKTRDGQWPSKDVFEEVLHKTVGAVLLKALDDGNVDTSDFIDRSLFLASDRPLDLPVEFTELPRPRS